MATQEEAVLELLMRRCAPDWETSTDAEKLEAFSFFCENFWLIRTPNGRIKMKLTAAQRQTVSVWIADRFSIALKARQVGFSTLAGAYAFWATFFYDDRQIIMISKGEREAMGLLAKARYGYRFLPDWMKMLGPLVESNQQRMMMSNESSVVSLPSAADPARGETAWLIIVDEMGQLPNSDDAYASIEPVADVGGRIIMLGTANGEGNLFHTLWVHAKGEWGDGTNRYTAIFHSWRAAEHRDDAWFEQQCRELPEWQRAQEYPDNPEEAFLKSGRPVFNMDALRAQPVDTPTLGQGFLLNKAPRQYEFRQNGGALKIWSWPVENRRYVMGVDVAEGLEHGDYSSVHVIDSISGDVVAHYHAHIDPDLLGSTELVGIGCFYNQALAVVEANNHGMTVLRALQRSRYFPIFLRRRLDNRSQPTTEAYGWLTTAKTKGLAIDELNKAIRDGDITIYDKDTVRELRTYVREGDGKMHGSPHDDRVMSLAIANQGLRYVTNPEYQVKKGPPVGSMDWFLARFDTEPEEDQTFIGAYATSSR